MPQALAAHIGAAVGQKVEVRIEGLRLIIEPIRKTYTWAEMLENASPEAMREAFDWGEEIGRERVDV
ncbi:MAG: hypothetical protein ACLPN5_04665 [Roseiarcus sp.]